MTHYYFLTIDQRAENNSFFLLIESSKIVDYSFQTIHSIHFFLLVVSLPLINCHLNKSVTSILDSVTLFLR